MFKYEIVNPPKFKINDEIVKEVFLKINKDIEIKQNGILNIVFVTPEEIQDLNKKYRNKDSVTDVLSFHYFEDFSTLNEQDIVGEMVFCAEKIISQALEYGLGEEKEFYKLLIHSILHILGYDHEKDDDYKIMQAIENKIWEEIFEKK